MRESESQREFDEAQRGSEAGDAERREVPCDEAVFFESFYAANVQGQVQDWMTMGSISEPEARFHYNSLENSIIRALLRIAPPPADQAVRMWRAMQLRQDLRLLDVGSGTGHWIDFMRAAFLVQRAVGLEVTARMSAYLREKYAEEPGVEVRSLDVASPGALSELGSFDLITAVGVLFHIVDDARWEAAVQNLAQALAPEGLLLISGELGSETRNVQFHRQDRFGSWREFEGASAEDGGEVRVNKRVRSLARHVELAGRLGLEVLDVVRSDREPGITTAENDLIVLRPRP